MHPHAERGAGRFRRRVRKHQGKEAEHIDAPAERRIGVARASACNTLPTMIPATIQPIVPSTRMIGKSAAASVTL